MTFVIGEKCLGERYATCVSVCPVDCMHPGEYKGETLPDHRPGRMHRLRGLPAGVPH